jgi:hypothetical protein
MGIDNVRFSVARTSPLHPVLHQCPIGPRLLKITSLASELAAIASLATATTPSPISLLLANGVRVLCPVTVATSIGHKLALIKNKMSKRVLI